VQTALAIVIDDAEPFDEVRREFAVDQVALGIPFHVTLLFPFAPPGELIDEARAFFAGVEPFEFELTRVAAWPNVVYAVPEPDTALRGCMRALFERFPHFPPYGGIHDEVIPHATLGEDVDGPAVRAEVEHRVSPYLPRRCQTRDVALLEEFEPGRWGERERFLLGG
jgi:2'-5' RNA ligase